MNRTSRLVRWWTVAACVLMMAAGCSDEPESGGSDEPTSQSQSPSSSPSKSEDAQPTEPPVPEAMANEDKAGAKAFVQYYWRIGDYAQVTGDVATFRQLMYPTCEPCLAGVRWIKRIAPKVDRVTGGALSVSGFKVTPLKGDGDRLFQVDHSVTNTRQVIHLKNGKKEVHRSAENRYRFTVSMDESGSWRVGLWEEPES